LLAKRLTARGVTLSAAGVAVLLVAESASAQVPAALETSTIRVAALVAAGQLTAAPAPAAVLMKGVMKAMLIRKLKVGAGAVMVLMVLGAIGFACRPGNDARAQDGTPARARDADQAPNLPVSRPVNRAAADDVDFTGRTEPLQSVDLRCRLAGPLTKVACKQGDAVKKGDLLFEVDPRPYEVELQKAEAEMQRADATRKKAADDLERAKKLMEARTMSKEDFDHAVGDFMVADAAAKVVRVGIERAKLDLEFTRVTAPINGVIVKEPLGVGNFVNAGTTTLATIASADPIGVVFDVDEGTYLDLQELARAGKIKNIRDGKYTVKMRLSNANDGDFKHEGVIDSVDAQADPKTGTVRVRAVFPNADGRLIPGLFARVRLTKSEPRPAKSGEGK
jgi:RND family efflux transporter MFP subunit